MPLSKDERKRAIQLANLRNAPAAPAGNVRALKHGAFSRAVPELRKRFLAELAEAFPNASEAEITIQAQRLSQLELLGGFLDERGVIRHRRRGETYPALALMERIAASYERQAAVLREREGEQGAEPTETLEQILEEYRTADEDGVQ